MILPAPHSSRIILVAAALGFAASAMAGFHGIAAPSSATGIALAATPTPPLSSPFGASADVSVTISNGIDELETGQTVIYQIAVTSAGPSATDAVIEVGFPFGLSCTWSCSADGGTSCPGPGSGNIDVPISLPVQASATFTASCYVATSIPIPPPENLMVAAQVSPTAFDPDWADNVASDTDALIPVVDVAVSIDDSVNIARYGHELVYQMGVFSIGADAMVRVFNPVPLALTDCTWTCQSFIGEFCPPASSGSGGIDVELVLPAWSGSQTEFVRFTSTCLVSPNATSNVVNMVHLELASPFRDSNPTDNIAIDTDIVVIFRGDFD